MINILGIPSTRIYKDGILYRGLIERIEELQRERLRSRIGKYPTDGLDAAIANCEAILFGDVAPSYRMIQEPQ